jgi:endonuclease/exonuclease/phosphatase family metal-dependent hydrolase
MQRLRVMTYNVRRCLGSDGTVSPERVARVIAGYRPDLVALQELDVGRPRTGGADQPGVIAGHLRMSYCFFPAFRAADEHYGDAVLSRLPLRLVRAGALPQRDHHERRGVVWVAVECGGRAVQVLNTHLSLDRGERLAQVEALLGPEWLGDPACAAPRLCCGDFNAWPRSRGYARLRAALRDAQESHGRGWPRSTFPARLPFLRIDHVFHSPDLVVRGVQVPRTALTRVASDHLPLLVEVSLP